MPGRQTVMIAAMLTAWTFASAAAQPSRPGRSTSKSTPSTLTWAKLTGTWSGVSYRGTGDSVMTHFSLTFGANEKLTVKRETFASAPARVVAMAGDSVVVEYGPVPATTRKGHTATIHEVMRLHGEELRGTLHSVFDDGATIDGTVKLKRQRKK